MKTPTQFPVRIKKGSATVTIYKVAQTKGGAEYVSFRVAYYDSEGKRRQEAFADYGEADRAARNVVANITQGDAKGLTLTAAERIAYLRAKAALEPLGIPIDTAAQTIAEAVKLMGGNFVMEACRHFARTNGASITKKAVQEIVDELIADKEADQCSAVYVRDLRTRLGAFAKAFQRPMANITGHEIDAWLKAQELSPRSRRNYRQAINCLAQYSIGKKYLPKDWSELDAVSIPKNRHVDITIYHPDELAKMLAACPADMVPFIAVGAFAGLRTAEIVRLDWRDIRLAQGLIEVPASKAKTASRRLVPITPNLAEWLKPHAKAFGPVCDPSQVHHGFKRITRPDSGITWKRNALRHSFISYRVAQIQNVPQVALEAGNSPQMIFSNYRELVTPQDAAAWFAISPQAAANVVPMKLATNL